LLPDRLLPRRSLATGRLAAVGTTAAQPILDRLGVLTGFPDVFLNLDSIVVLLLAWVIVIIAFFVLAVQLFVTLIEFKLTTLAGFVLVPFALWNKTAFLAERVLGNVVSSGIKVLVLAVIVASARAFLGNSPQPRGGHHGELCTRPDARIACAFWIGTLWTGIATGSSPVRLSWARARWRVRRSPQEDLRLRPGRRPWARRASREVYCGERNRKRHPRTRHRRPQRRPAQQLTRVRLPRPLRNRLWRQRKPLKWNPSGHAS